MLCDDIIQKIVICHTENTACDLVCKKWRQWMLCEREQMIKYTWEGSLEDFSIKKILHWYENENIPKGDDILKIIAMLNNIYDSDNHMIVSRTLILRRLCFYMRLANDSCAMRSKVFLSTKIT
tara:strand:- start:843 stop:1211 length:369 start_codon:yes stop_codon:yes gene_type:complete